MRKAELLDEIRAAEAEVQEMKNAAAKERERILREARREALDVRERYRAEADAAHAVILRSAEERIAEQREAILAEGRRRAEALRGEGEAHREAAVARLMDAFQGALDA